MPDNADFRRLLDKRMKNLRQTFKVIGNLARYPHDRSEAEGVIAAAQAELDMLRAKFKVEPESLPVQAPQPKLPEGGNVKTCAVDGTDRRDIRAAVNTIRDGDVRGGVKALQHVIVGWQVPDRVD